jgi:2-keto-4-pentenoate hydratase
MIHPRVVAALDRQLATWRTTLAAGAERVGWKIGRAFPEIEAVIGDEPVLGHLTSATQLEPGSEFDGTGLEALRAETEIALTAGEDHSIAEVAVALELVDVTRPPDDLEGIVVGNVAHRAFVLGAAHPPEDLTGRAATLRVNGALRESAGVPAGYGNVIAAVARLLTACGERLEPGDVVLSGSLTHVPVGHSDHAVAEIDGLGRVEVVMNAAC